MDNGRDHTLRLIFVLALVLLALLALYGCCSVDGFQRTCYGGTHQ